MAGSSRDFEPINACVAGPGVDLQLGTVSLYKGCCCINECQMREEADTCSCKIAFDCSGHLDSAFLSSVSAPVFECNSCCTCPLSCPKRVTQRCSRWQLSVFETEKKGLGLRTLDGIPKGSYVIEYVGEIINATERRRRLAALNSQEPCYLVVFKEHTPNRTLVTTVDATRKGNLARFINHSCRPNLVVVPVRSDSVVPRLCLFACRDIAQGEELTFSYFGRTGSEAIMSGGISYGPKRCWCGAEECIGYLPYEQ